MKRLRQLSMFSVSAATVCALAGCTIGSTDSAGESSSSTVGALATDTVTVTAPGPTTTVHHTATETATITKYVIGTDPEDAPADPSDLPEPPEGSAWTGVGPHSSESTCEAYRSASEDETSACFEKENGWFYNALRPESPPRD